jgi:lipopolysaccharide export system protein LptA
MLSVRRYFAALAVTVASWGAYALVVAPWLEPPPLSRLRATAGQPMKATWDWQLDDLFEAEAWERNDPKVVETADFTLLLRDYQPLPDGRMRIEPCTLIFYAAQPPDDSGKDRPLRSRRPIVVRAPQGAELQFDRPFDVGTATIGRLVEGKLSGPIRIYSPATRPDAGDALELTTRNVKINREKVYTPHEVNFRYGNSFGYGRDLTISLLPQEEGRRGRSPSLGGLSLLQLARVERLHLEGSASGFFPDPSPGAGEPGPPPKEAPLEVRCSGPLTVDFEDGVAAIEENVEISRVYPQGPPDKLTCDRLIFHMLRGPAAKERQAAASGGPPTVRQLAERVESVVAQGRPVVLDAPQSATYARAAEVIYFAGIRRVELSGGPGAPQVELRRQAQEFKAARIAYDLAEPGRLGNLLAAGPGSLKFTFGTPDRPQSVEASWQIQLEVSPRGKNKLISLTGAPHIALGSDSSFSAGDLPAAAGIQRGEIHLWVLEVPRQATAAAGAAAAISNPQSALRFEIVPDRMLASGAVAVDSPQLAARTTSLKTWFVHQAPPAEEPRHNPGVVFEPIRGPEPDSEPERPPAIGKLEVRGREIQLRVIRRGSDTAVEDLAIQGAVHVEELIPPDQATAPLSLDGDLVTLRRGTSPEAKLEVSGRPAKVAARGLSLSGATIHLRRMDNRLWIPGPGEAVLPLTEAGGDALGPLEPLSAPRTGGSSAAVESDERSSQAPRPLKVAWREAFEFDGQTGVFSGAIEVRGDRESASGDQLTFVLDRRIDFSQPRQEGRPQLARLELVGAGRDISMRRALVDETGAQVALEQGRVNKLVIDRAAGKLFAEGPGEVWTVRRGLGPLAAPAASPQDEGKLSYIGVTFREGIEGDLARREIQFRRDVHTIYGPVEGWNQRIIAERLEDLGETGVHVKSDTLSITEMSLPPDRRWIEIDARGNTLAEGKKFVAQAARIGYSSDKDQLVISGEGRSLAQIWLRNKPDERPSHSEAGRFLYQRRTNTLEIDGGRAIDVGSLPRRDRPPPKLR